MKITLDFNLILHLLALSVVIALAVLFAKQFYRWFRDLKFYLRRGSRLEREIEEINRCLHGEPFSYRMNRKPIEYRIMDLEEAVKKINQQQKPTVKRKKA